MSYGFPDSLAKIVGHCPIPTIRDKKIALCVLLATGVFTVAGTGVLLTASAWSIKLGAAGVVTAMSGLITFIAYRSFFRNEPIKDPIPLKQEYVKARDEFLLNNALEQEYQAACDEPVDHLRLEKLKKLADRGHINALGDIDVMYHKGFIDADGTDIQNWDLAFHYRRLKLAEQGNVDAQFGLACLYYDGNKKEGVEKDLSKAYKYCKLAADQNHQQAKRHLPQMENALKQEKCETIKKENDPLVRFNKMKELADKDNSHAQLEVAIMFEEKNKFHDALDYYEKAADRANPIAQYKMAFFYYSKANQKEDIERNMSRALFYSRQGARKNSDAKQLFIKICETHGTEKDKAQAAKYALELQKS